MWGVVQELEVLELGPRIWILGVLHLLFIVRGVGALEKGQHAGADILGSQGHVVLLIFRFWLQAWGV